MCEVVIISSELDIAPYEEIIKILTASYLGALTIPAKYETKWVLAVVDGSAASMAQLIFYKEYVEINFVYTLPEFCGRGYAKKVIQEIISITNCELRLVVDRGNTVAIGLYESCGFRIKERFDDNNLQIMVR